MGKLLPIIIEQVVNFVEAHPDVIQQLLELGTSELKAQLEKIAAARAAAGK